MRDDQQPGGFGMDNDQNDKQNDTAWHFDEDPQNNFEQPPIDPTVLIPEDDASVQKGKTARVLGITGLSLSVVCCCLPPVGLVLGILALVFSLRSKKGLGKFSTPALVGFICGIIAIVISTYFLANMVTGIVRLYTDPDYRNFYREFYNRYYEQFNQ